MFGKKREVFVYNKSKETFLSFRVGVADSFLSRMIGLLGKRSLKPDGGVWIVPANSIHTVGMLFPFDLVMVDKNFRVVSLKEMVRPFCIVLPKLRAYSVIELPAHAIFRSRTEVGDQLIIDHYEPKQIPIPASGAGRVPSLSDQTPLEPTAHTRQAVPTKPCGPACFHAEALFPEHIGAVTQK